MAVVIAPSLLAANFSRIGEDVKILQDNGIEELHLDVMDGHFVPNITFGPDQIHDVAAMFPLMKMDAHLMVDDPDGVLIERLAKAGVTSITVHMEACPHLYRTLELISSLGLEAGVALNPATPFNALIYAAKAGLLGRVLLMTVEPGFGGQKYIPISTEKIMALAKWRHDKGFSFTIQIDGGITPQNIAVAAGAGAENIVVGSAVFKNNQMKKNLQDIKRALADF